MMLGAIGAGVLSACVGDDPGATLSPDNTDGSPSVDGSTLPDGGPNEGPGDGGDGGDEPTPDGGVLSVQHFAVDPSFPGGIAKVAFAQDGSLFVGFTFQGSTTVLGTQLVGNGSSDDIGVAKIGPDGNPAWVKSFGGSGGDELYGLAVDGAGDVYIAGSFASTSVTFEVARTLGTASAAPFVAKLAGATGAAIKSVTFHKASEGGTCTSIAARAGVVAVGCTMAGTAQVTMSTGGTTDVDPPGPGAGILLAELDPTSLGALWTNGLGSAAGDHLAGVDVTPSGDLVFAALSGNTVDVPLTDTKGSVNVTIRRSPTTLVGRLAKSSGLASWVKVFGTNEQGRGIAPNGIAADADANIVFCGDLKGTVDVGGTSISQIVPDSELASMAVVKLGANGTTVAARAFGGTSDEYVRAVATDRWNNVLLTGRYTSSDFSIDGHVMPAPAGPGNQVLFAIKMSPSLVTHWGFGATTGGGSLIQGQGIAAAPSGKVAYVGMFGGTADFGDGEPRQSGTNGADVNAAVVTRLP